MEGCQVVRGLVIRGMVSRMRAQQAAPLQRIVRAIGTGKGNPLGDLKVAPTLASQCDGIDVNLVTYG